MKFGSALHVLLSVLSLQAIPALAEVADQSKGPIQPEHSSRSGPSQRVVNAEGIDSHAGVTSVDEGRISMDGFNPNPEHSLQKIWRYDVKPSITASNLDLVAWSVATGADENQTTELKPVDASAYKDQDLDASDEKDQEAFMRLVELGAALNLFHHTETPYGAPSSTTQGPINARTHLLGDWGGLRKSLAQKGVLVDLWTTSFYQGIAEGSTNNSGWLQTAELDITLSTDIAGLWPGGFLHFGVDAKFGDSLNPDAGAFSPVNYAGFFPVYEEGDFVYPTEYYLFQTLGSNNLVAVVGKATPINFADLNVFAGNKNTQFMNTSFNNNPMLGAFVPPASTWVAALVWQINPNIQSSTVAIDPNGAADNFADKFFDDVTVAQQFAFKWGQDKLPGSILIGGLWSSKDSVNFANPADIRRRLVDGQLSFTSSFNKSSDGSMAYLTFDQYLWRLPDSSIDENLFFYNPRGFGIFGRLGIGPEDSNLVSRFVSLGFGGNGAIPGRPYDNFGLGWYYLGFSDGIIDSLQKVSNIAALKRRDGSPKDVKNEAGVELFYTFAITPAVSLTADLQYIFNPLLSSSDGELVLGGRLNITF